MKKKSCLTILLVALIAASSVIYAQSKRQLILSKITAMLSSGTVANSANITLANGSVITIYMANAGGGSVSAYNISNSDSTLASLEEVAAFIDQVVVANPNSTITFATEYTNDF